MQHYDNNTQSRRSAASAALRAVHCAEPCGRLHHRGPLIRRRRGGRGRRRPTSGDGRRGGRFQDGVCDETLPDAQPHGRGARRDQRRARQHGSLVTRAHPPAAAVTVSFPGCHQSTSSPTGPEACGCFVSYILPSACFNLCPLQTTGHEHTHSARDRFFGIFPPGLFIEKP